jgi:glycosyltransferase involved in cell wall biosynthesis
VRFSIVTISFNQVEFLKRAIDSVLAQTDVQIEYIVADPGSTDGSRELIASYANGIAHKIFEPDDGPADGLNKGFARATGDIYCYLNSDDMLASGALKLVADFFEQYPDTDVACGHAWIVDRSDTRIRRLWSNKVDRLRIAYRASEQVQPSTFIRAAAFRRAGGFNPENRSNWDGELITELLLSGARFRIMDAFVSCYRLHGDSITNSGKVEERMWSFFRRRFQRLMGRERRPADRWIELLLRIEKNILSPRAALERIVKGPIFKRGAD